MTITGGDRVIDENDNCGVVVSVVNEIATILPDYADGDVGYCYLMHIDRLDKLDDDGLNIRHDWKGNQACAG